MNRSRKEKDEIVARMDFLRDLLKEFGASLSGYQPGVTAYVIDEVSNKIIQGRGWAGETLSFEFNEWKWLEPLLIELRERRKAQNEAQYKRPRTKSV